MDNDEPRSEIFLLTVKLHLHGHIFLSGTHHPYIIFGSSGIKWDRSGREVSHHGGTSVLGHKTFKVLVIYLK